MAVETIVASIAIMNMEAMMAAMTRCRRVAGGSAWLQHGCKIVQRRGSRSRCRPCPSARARITIGRAREAELAHVNRNTGLANARPQPRGRIACRTLPADAGSAIRPPMHSVIPDDAEAARLRNAGTPLDHEPTLRWFGLNPSEERGSDQRARGFECIGRLQHGRDQASSPKSVKRSKRAGRQGSASSFCACFAA